ncbi:DUF2851 family protein [Candidatus Poribacteria bacterium]|nr:DUF2851 family protein [Candidatus Poribacteria bacterium]
MSVRYKRYYEESLVEETFVKEIWDGGYFSKDRLRAKDGRRIEILSPGHFNEDTGADFREAQVRMDGKMLEGDVELHVKCSHWKTHRHHTNPRYNQTILHVVMWDDSIKLLTKKQNGQVIPTLILYNYLQDSIGKLWKQIKEDNKAKPLPCNKRWQLMRHEDVCSILDKAGMDRFYQKALDMEEKAAKSHLDQVFYQELMRSLGYSKNKEQFFELSRLVPLYSLKGLNQNEIESALFILSGLTPHPEDKINSFDTETNMHISHLWNLWDQNAARFEYNPMNSDKWEFCGVRPDNFPTIRLAGMSFILADKRDKSLLDKFIYTFKKSKTNDIIKNMRVILMPASKGYWGRYYNFGKIRKKEPSVLIGHNRADDMIINIVLPALFNHAKIIQDKDLQQNIISLYRSYKKIQDNRITRKACMEFLTGKNYKKIINSAIRQQGLIHIQKTYCNLNNCASCPVKV